MPIASVETTSVAASKVAKTAAAKTAAGKVAAAEVAFSKRMRRHGSGTQDKCRNESDERPPKHVTLLLSKVTTLAAP
jgi:hypothetical protein